MSTEESNRPLPAIVQRILHALLDQAEQIDRKTVVRVRMDKSHHPDYWDRHTAAPRGTTNTTLRDLEAQGFVQLHWQKDEEGNWLQSVDLVREHSGAIYLLLGRIPRSRLEDAFRLQLSTQEPIPGWHAGFLAWVESQLAGRRSLAPLDLTNPEQTHNLLHALSAIARLEEPVLERILSIRLFSNSKQLEALRSDILTVLRAHDPETIFYGDDIKAILQAHYVDTVPEHVVIAGPLQLQTSYGIHDLSSFYPSIAPSAATVRAAYSISTTAERVITVENATSFSELAAIRSTSTLLLLTSGFASPAMLYLLKKIHMARPDVSLLHWGDLDVGGLRILAQLRRHIPTFTSLAMDPATFKGHLHYGQALSPRERHLLLQLRTQPLLRDCIPLIDMLLSEERKLEQEAIRPSWFLERV